MNRAPLIYLLAAACLCWQGWGCQLSKPNSTGAWKGVRRVYILPAADADTHTVHFLARYIADCVGVPVQLMPPTALPAWTWYAPRKRYWADSLLKWMTPMANNPQERWLLVTTSDISTTRKTHFNWGVMGLAYQPGRVAVVSDYRLHEHRRSAASIHAALLKIALHELGHTAGLPHCAEARCLMQDADGRDKTGILTHFCNTCRERLFKP